MGYSYNRDGVTLGKAMLARVFLGSFCTEMRTLPSRGFLRALSDKQAF